MGRLKNSQSTLVSIFLKYGKKGDEFCIATKDRDVTARATYYNRKVLTKRVVVLEGTALNPIARAMVKITLLNDPPVDQPLIIATPGQVKQIFNFKNNTP